MAIYLLRVNWLWDDAIVSGGDRIVWGYHVDAAAAPNAADFATDFEAAALVGPPALVSILPTALEVESYQVYDVVAGGPPVDAILPDPAFSGTGGTGGPSEVQVTVSRRVNDGLGRPFKKGRSYIGPLAEINLNQVRPSAALRDIVGDFSVLLHEAFEARGWTPVVDTKGALHVPETIVDYVVDDAWDTQRRRGLDPITQNVYTPA